MYSPAPDEPLTRRIVFVGKEIRESFQDLLARHGTTIPTWAVLTFVHRTPGLSQSQLAGHIGIEGPTLARHLDRLCAEGLVVRRRDEHDRRIVRVALTKAGERRWSTLKDVADTMEQRLTRHLSPELRAELGHTLDLIQQALENVDAPLDTPH